MLNRYYKYQFGQCTGEMESVKAVAAKIFWARELLVRRQNHEFVTLQLAATAGEIEQLAQDVVKGNSRFVAGDGNELGCNFRDARADVDLDPEALFIRDKQLLEADLSRRKGPGRKWSGLDRDS